VIVERGELHAERGSGRFIPRTTPMPCATERELTPSTRFFRSLSYGAHEQK
jgi:dihydropyrimidinase